MLVRATHYRTGQRCDFTFAESRPTTVTPLTSATPDVEADWIAPAFCDVQINGCDGVSFNAPDLTREQIRHVVAVCQKHGISQLCPTLITGSFEALAHGFRTLSAARESDADLARAIVGFHLEGPYISPDDGPRGAHPKPHVRPPDWDEFRRWQEAAGGLIRMVTLAPETPGALAFIEQAAAAGVVVAIGHTAATSEIIRAAVVAGARISTHLGNGSHALLPRHDNYLWEQLAHDGLWASIIADGHHLPEAALRCIVRAKTSARLLLTCDAGSLAGLPPGVYRQWDQEFEVHPAGKIVVPGTPFLAGSWAFTDHCVGHLLSLGETSLADTLDLAGAQPRRLLGLPVCKVEDGDAVLFDWRPGEIFRLAATMLQGQVVTSSERDDPQGKPGA
jgi:N-acetylglucosamine-6-phosphate deacetylase